MMLAISSLLTWVTDLMVHLSVLADASASESKYKKAQEDVSKHLVSITGLLVGADTEQQSDIVLAQLSQEMYNSGLLLLLLKNMHRIDFEVDIYQLICKRQNSLQSMSRARRTPRP